MDTKKYTFELLKVKPMSGVNKRKESGFLDDVFEKTVKKYGLKNPIPKKKKGGLIGGQKKLDANKDGKISGEDFKMLRGSRKGMRMGGYAGSETSKRQGPSKLATPPKKGKMGADRKKVRGN